MNKKQLIALALSGILLPDIATATPSLSVSIPGLSKALTPTLAARPARRAKQKSNNKKQTAVTPDLPENFSAAGEGDIFPIEDAAYSTLRKLCHYLNTGNSEAALKLFNETVELFELNLLHFTNGATPEELHKGTNISPSEVIAKLQEYGYLTASFEVLQVTEKSNDKLKVLICQISQNSDNRYSTLTLLIDTSTGLITKINVAIWGEEANEAPPSAVLLDVDTLIKSGAKEVNLAPAIKSAAAAESNGWWVPDMEFTKDDKVKASILGPSLSPMHTIQLKLLMDSYLNFLRATDMSSVHGQVMGKFAPRVYLIGQNREVSREELYSILADKELLLDGSSYVTASGYKGHCFQFVICCPNEKTRQKEYIRVCMLMDRNLQITGIMESKCVNAPATVNPSFNNTGVTVEVVDHSGDPSGEEWVKRLLDTWASADESAWNELLDDKMNYLYLPGMTSSAQNVVKQEAVELMLESVPQLLAGGYEIVKVNDKDKHLCEAHVVFNTPAPNGKKVKAVVSVNYIKVIHNFEINMYYVDDNKKFTQSDFISAIDGINPEDIPVEERKLSDVPPDKRGAEALRRILEGIKAGDDQAVADVLGERNHINSLAFPKDGLESRISSNALADVKAGIQETLPHLDKVGYRIYVTRTQYDGVCTDGILAINEGKSRGAANYEFSIIYQHGQVTTFAIRSQSGIVIGNAKSSSNMAIEVPAPEGVTLEVVGLCPADMDFSANSLVKEAEAKAPTSDMQMILENACSNMALQYMNKRKMGTGRHSEMGKFQDPDIMSSQISVIGEDQQYSADALFARLDSPELLWGSECSIYKMGYKGSSLHIIYRFGAENEDPMFISTVLLVDQFGALNYTESKIYAVGESVLENREPELMPGYQRARTAEEQQADAMAQAQEQMKKLQQNAGSSTTVSAPTAEPAAPAATPDTAPVADNQQSSQSSGLIWAIIGAVGAFMLGIIAVLLVLLLKKKAPEAPKAVTTPAEEPKAPQSTVTPAEDQKPTDTEEKAEN